MQQKRFTDLCGDVETGLFHDSSQEWQHQGVIPKGTFCFKVKNNIILNPYRVNSQSTGPKKDVHIETV